IARGLVLPFTVIFTYVLLRQPSSKLVLGACFIVFCGFYTGVTSEINVSQWGVFFGIISSVTTSLHAIVIKKSLAAVNNSSIDLVYYNNALSFMAMTPIIFLSGESSLVLGYLNSEGFSAFHAFLFAAFITGIFGFLVNLAGFLQISKTSPTTHMISGAVRGVTSNLGLSERQAVFLTVGFYMISALLMVSCNKWALNELRLPWTLLWCQMLIAVTLLKFTDYLGVLKMPVLRKDVAKALIPLISINVLGLGVNTLCLAYVDTSFYQ
ncbi:hypothetical protein BGZ49_005611, partial [Haplosporangium sp. Z 27]